MAERIIQTPEDLDLWITYLVNRKLPITVSAVDGRDRTLDQNRLQFLWAREAADQRGDVTADEVRNEWKLVHGVPILREEDAEFRETYDPILKGLPYVAKLKLMSLIEVTSRMKVRQMVRFLDAVSRECAENGIKLTDPDPDLASYQSRYREQPRKAA